MKLYLGHPDLDLILIIAAIIAFPMVVMLYLGSTGYYDVKPTELETILNGLNCNELKEWLKYNLESETAVHNYAERCLK